MNSNLSKLKKPISLGSLIFCITLSLFHQTGLLGKLSLVLLTIIMFTRPLVRLFPRIGIFKTALVFRRQLGQASAFAVLGHIFSQIVPGFGLTDLLVFAATSGPSNFIFWGFLGFVLILPLLLTSNDFSVRLLGQNWKRVQWLVHPLYIFVMLHWGLREESSGVFMSLAVLVTLYTARLLADRNVKFL